MRNHSIPHGQVSRQSSSPEPSLEEVRRDLKALIEKGYLRWLDPVRTPDEYADDEPLPIEFTDKPLPPPVGRVTEEQKAELLALLGVGDLVGIEGTEDRVVNLSPRSELGCPMHELRLMPDACRSCRFLAGEVA